MRVLSWNGSSKHFGFMAVCPGCEESCTHQNGVDLHYVFPLTAQAPSTFVSVDVFDELHRLSVHCPEFSFHRRLAFLRERWEIHGSDCMVDESDIRASFQAFQEVKFHSER